MLIKIADTIPVYVFCRGILICDMENFLENLEDCSIYWPL